MAQRKWSFQMKFEGIGTFGQFQPPPEEGPYGFTVKAFEVMESKNTPGLQNVMLTLALHLPAGGDYEARKYLSVPNGKNPDKDAKYMRGWRTALECIGYDPAVLDEGTEVKEDDIVGSDGVLYWRPPRERTQIEIESKKKVYGDFQFVVPEHAEACMNGEWKPWLPPASVAAAAPDETEDEVPPEAEEEEAPAAPPVQAAPPPPPVRRPPPPGALSRVANRGKAS